MPAYEAMLMENLNNMDADQELEVILVDDSPWCEITAEGLKTSSDKRISVSILTNPENIGIHGTRVNGLNEASGEYVMFLDQDDALSPTAVRDFLRRARQENGALCNAIVSGADAEDEVMAACMYVANASLEQKDGSYELWYRSDYHKKQIGRLSTYINVGTQIISPGQVMLPKVMIPEAYRTYQGHKNGADDYFLWLLLLNEETEVAYIDKPLYTHHFSGKNISADTKNTDESSYEFLDNMEKNSLMDISKINKLRRMLDYKDRFRNGSRMVKLKSSLANLDILIPNIIFKLKTKTPYGYNR